MQNQKRRGKVADKEIKYMKLLVNKLTKLYNKQNMLDYFDTFNKYIEYMKLPAENVALTLNVLFQGNVPLDHLKIMDFTLCSHYIASLVESQAPLEDIILFAYGLILVAKANSEGKLEDYEVYKRLNLEKENKLYHG